MTPLNFSIFSQERTPLTKLNKWVAGSTYFQYLPKHQRLRYGIKKRMLTKELGKIATILREERILTGN